MSDLLLIFPEVSEDLVSNMMIAITKKIEESGDEIAVQGILGGTYGYGAHCKNDVFEMRPFYWGDCICDYEQLRNVWEEANHHSDHCYQTIFHNRHYVNYGADDGWNFDVNPGHEKDENYQDKCTCIVDICKMFHINPNMPGSHVHCTCDYDVNHRNFINTISHSQECQMDKPNFHHYSSGVKVEWYKYIGRDMEYDDSIPVEIWVNIFKEVLESINEARA